MGKNFGKSLIVISILWAVYFIEWLVPGNFNQMGIIPRTMKGLIGIPLSPFIHNGLWHLITNSIGLVGLLTIAFSYSSSMTYKTLTIITFLGGGMVWLFGSAASHIGASGWIYGLVGFLLVIGIFRKEMLGIVISLIVFFIYGGLFFSMFKLVPGVSFTSHLFGFISGIISASITKNDHYNRPSHMEV